MASIHLAIQIFQSAWFEGSTYSILPELSTNLLLLVPLTLGMIHRDVSGRIHAKTKSLPPRQSSLRHMLASIHQFASTLDLQETLSKLAKIVSELLRSEMCAIEYTAQGRHTHSAWHKTLILDSDQASTVAGLLFSESNGNKILGISSSECASERMVLLEQMGLYSVMERPIIWQGHEQGTIMVASKKLKPFAPSDQRLLALLCQQLAIVLQNCSVNDALRKQAADAEALFRITKTLNSALPFHVLLNYTLKSILEMLGQSVGTVLLYDNGKLKCVSGIGLDEENNQNHEWTPDEGIAGVCFCEKRPVVAAQIEHDPRFSSNNAGPFSSGSALAAPLLIENRAIGVLVIKNTLLERVFGTDEVRNVMTVANQMAGAIERLRLLEQVEQRAVSLGSLLEVARTIGSNLEMEDVLPIIGKAAVELLGVNASCIMLLEPETRMLAISSATNLSQDFISRTKVPWGEPIGGWVAAQAKPVMISDIENEPEIPSDQIAKMQIEGLRSYLGVPLRIKGVTIGVLNVFTRETTRDFSNEEAELLTILANQAAVAIENVRLFKNEEETIAKLRQLARHRVELADMMSHELRTPLTSVKGFAQLMMRCQHQESTLVEKYAGVIYAESTKMVDTINEILDLSNMERGLIELRREPIDIKNILETAIESARRTYNEFTFELDVPRHIPPIRSDADKIRQVLSSLIGLTARFTAGEHKTITITARLESTDKGIIVSVGHLSSRSDTSQINTLLIDPVGFGNTEMSTQFRAGALSLYKCRNFIQALGGELWLEDDENRGARLFFRLGP